MVNKIFIRALCLLCTAGMLLTGCTLPVSSHVYGKYQYAFLGVFDTVVQVIGYAKSQKEFDGYAQQIQSRFEELSRLYDRFYEYDGINNICTINKNAGIAPVQVEEEILDLLEFAQEAYEISQGTVNVALGPVLEVWHSYMERYSQDPENAILPSRQELESAAAHTRLDLVKIDREAGTVFLEEKGMLLDVGAVAKGYATQRVADEIYAAGFTSFVISAGGNVVTGDAPLDGVRGSWGIGIQDPEADVEDPQAQSVDVVFVKNRSVVSSGDYQRYYMVDGMRVHHLIDPETLMPAGHYREVTVVCDDSGMGDLLSTALFVLDYPESRALAEFMDLQVMWIFEGGRVEYTDSLLPLLRDRGGATAALEENEK